MRIATWNVNGLRARLDYVRDWLRERQPDVVALQELKAATGQFPADPLLEEGYHAAVHGQKAWNGVAVLSREPAERVEAGLPGHEELGARLIAATIGGLRVLSVYVPNGKSVEHEDFHRKLAFFDALGDRLAPAVSAGEPLVLAGDFNVAPTALDTWDEEGHRGRIFHTDEERERFRRLAELGLVDLYRARHPDGRDFTWWDYRGGAFHRGFGLRIDFLLATRPVAERVREVFVDRDFRKKRAGLSPSDHAPVVADLEDP